MSRRAGRRSGAIAALLRAWLAAGRPDGGVRRSGSRTRCCARSVRGYLTGSIDLVACAPPDCGTGRPRFAIVDYKTNWLAAARRAADRLALPPGGARGARCSRSHYALQALLYAVALHRYLRWRLPGYDPDRDLAGVLYLFLRGHARRAALR